jgi:hypothetical protein
VDENGKTLGATRLVQILRRAGIVPEADPGG